MQIIHEGPVRAYVHGGDIVDYQVVCNCTKRELQSALASLGERCGAQDYDAEETAEHSLFDDPEKLMRGLR